MIGFGEASKRFFTKAFDFQGRATRSEYWFAVLMLLLAIFALFSQIDALGEPGLALFGLFSLVIIIPFLSLVVRRLHDTDKSGFWLLIYIVPFGGFILLVFFCLEGTKGDNKYGPDPYGNIAIDVFG